MRRFKRIFAGLICATMILSSNPVTSFAMEDNVIEAVSEETTIEDTTDEATITEEIIEDTEEITEELTEETTEETTEEITEETTEATTEVEDESEAPLMNFLVIGEDYVSVPGSQYIAADFGNEETVIDEAYVNYTNTITNKKYTVKASNIVAGSVLFEFEFKDLAMTGVYEVESVDLVVGDDTFNITLKETGAAAFFGVNKVIEAEPYAWLIDETENAEKSEDVPGVAVLDKENDTLSSSAVAEAIKESENIQVPKDAIEVQNLSADKKVDDGILIICIDPGHGGGDTGASRAWNGYTYIERDINLKIAKACKKELSKYSGVKVYLTRSDNSTSLSLTERAEYAKKVKADVLISMHINSTAAASTTSTGSEVIIPNTSYNLQIHNEADALGKKILEKLSKLGLANRGTYSRNTTIGEVYDDGSIADYYTLIYATKVRGITGMIVEHAFVSNQSDCETYLKSDASIESLGKSDAAAIIAYYNLKKSKSKYLYDGIDYQHVFNFDYYVNKYSDVKKKYAKDEKGALKHFVTVGIPQARQGCEDFDVKAYRNRYAELRKKYGKDYEKYYLDYINEGYDAKRIAIDCPELMDPITEYNGVDYSKVYDFNFYINKYSSIKKKYGDDDLGAIKNFVTAGMKKGRQGCESFDVKSYRNRYQDIRIKYGKNYLKYFDHYMKKGYKTRKGTYCPTILNPVTKYKNVDYKDVYDFNYYIEKYPAVAKKYGDDDVAALEYFVKTGMSKAHQASAEFNVHSYRYRYSSLRKKYYLDYPKYYLHYIKKGKAEGKIGTGCKTFVKPITSYKGMNYKLVYDYNYFKANNKVSSKIKRDDATAIKYFVEKGMKKGLVGSANFNVEYYKSNYPDLRKKYGDDLKKYYIHYIKKGYKEGRVADRLIYTEIMGESQTTVDQMVAYYKAYATYPAYYKKAKTDAPTIEKFCKIYYEECQAEGIRAEVAFCQSMKETGFLRYGGQVKIEQFNFAGLGATDDGSQGASFSTVRKGIRAHIQHLKAYASTEKLNKKCVDPRFSYVERGCAKYVEWLGINENPKKKGWATAKNYGYSIKSDYMDKLATY